MAVADLGRGVRNIVVGVGALAFAASLRESPVAALTVLAVTEEAAELAGIMATMEKEPPAVRDEMRLEASAGGRVCVSVGRVTEPLAGRVIVIVTVVLSSPESSGVPSPCPLSSLLSSSSEEQSSSSLSSVLEVELTIGKGTVTFDDAVDTTPPFAPVADIIDWALFGLVHATNW